LAIRVGVIGVGYLGQHHARIYSELNEIELAGIADLDKKRADELAGKFQCKSYSNYEDMLGSVDALSIATPTTSHHDIALACIRAGKDILIEKPVTVTVAEADNLIAASAGSDCIIQVGHLERYNPAFILASSLTTAPVFVEAERLSPFLGRATDVDVTLDLMIHDIDILLNLIASPVKEIRAAGNRVITQKLDIAKTWIEFANGCVAIVTASRISPEKQRRMKIFQKDFSLLVDYQTGEVTRYPMSKETISPEVLRTEKREPLKEELKDFVHCIRHRKRPGVSLIEGREALDIVMEINNNMIIK
jgi:predicted dehydrogenase